MLLNGITYLKQIMHIKIIKVSLLKFLVLLGAEKYKFLYLNGSRVVLEVLKKVRRVICP